MVDIKIALIIVLSLVAVALFISSSAGAPSLTGFSIFRDEQSYDLLDKCGRFVNLVSHTIENVDVCEVRCKAQCNAEDERFIRVEFEASQTTCNQCTCFCK